MDYTIVIPVYNKEEHLYKAVQSALKQTLSPTSILVIDDCSTDNSILQLEDFIEESRIKIIQMSENVGISKVLNNALKHIRTPYFLQLDGDDWLEPHAAEKLVTALHNNPSAAFAYGNHRLWEYDDQSKLVFLRYLIQPIFSNKYDFLLKLGYMLNPRCYRTASVRQIKGWLTNDPWEGRYLEDARMIIRLAEKFSWIHIQDILHNVVLNQERSRKKYPMFNHIRKEFYEEVLWRWGKEYTPVWKTNNTQVVFLEQLIPKNKAASPFVQKNQVHSHIE